MNSSDQDNAGKPRGQGGEQMASIGLHSIIELTEAVRSRSGLSPRYERIIECLNDVVDVITICT